MALKIKIDPVEHFTPAIVRNDISADTQGREIAAFVNQGISEADDVNRRVLGRVPPRRIMVDGRLGAPLESVNPDGGQIVVEYELVGEVLIWIAKKLEERSPVVSGDYRHGHMLFADGKVVAIGGEVPIAEEYVFVNFVPYARKIEIGKTQSGRDFVIQVPNKIYQRTAGDAKSEFGNVAKIEFTYESVNGGAIATWAASPSARRLAAKKRGGDPAKHHEWLTRQPAIIVRFLRS